MSTTLALETTDSFTVRLDEFFPPILSPLRLSLPLDGLLPFSDFPHPREQTCLLIMAAHLLDEETEALKH